MKLNLRARYSLIILSSIISVVLLLTAAVLLQTKSVIHRVTDTSSRIMEEALLGQLEYRAESLVDIEKMRNDLGVIGAEGMRQNVLAIAIIAVALSILGVIVATLVAKSLSHPINIISAHTKRIGRGEYDVNIPIKRSDEIGELTESFNKMAKNLRETTFSRNFLHNILKSMIDPLIVSDSNKAIYMVNRAGCYLLGYKDEGELIGSPMGNIFSKSVNESGERDRLIKLINQGIMYYETTFRTKHGIELPVLVSGSSIKDENNNVIWTICTAADITKRKQAEEKLQTAYNELKETQSQLIQAEKMEAIGRMASGIAHEVKNPLGVILQGVNCLEMKISPVEKETFEILQKMKNNIERADLIIRGLVDFSRLTELKLEPVDMNSVLDKALTLVHHRIKLERIKITRELKENLPKVLADQGKLEQVFVNLFLNAIQAMPNGGKLFLRSYLLPLGRKKGAIKDIEGYFADEDQCVVVEIEDTGMGISEEDLKKIFDPFFSTKEPGEGTGLGLSVTMNIVDMHKGSIEIKSKVNKGTKAIIALKPAKGGKDNA